MLLASFPHQHVHLKFTLGAAPDMADILSFSCVDFVLSDLEAEALAVKRDRWRDLFFRCLLDDSAFMPIETFFGGCGDSSEAQPHFYYSLCHLDFKEKLTKGKLGSLALGFLGAMVVIRPSGDYKLLPFLAALNAAICTGVSMTFLRKLHTMNSLKVIFYFSLTCLLGTAPATLTNLTMFPANIWMLLGGIALAGGLGNSL